jgi:APA family basic amino acid/polyamine antiporter
VVGFAAPVAAAAHAFGAYSHALWPALPALAASLFLLVFFTFLHGFHLAWGQRFQDGFTLIKLLLIVGFIVAGISAGTVAPPTPAAQADLLSVAFTPAFAVGLIYITFSYSGWNAAIYVAGEVRDPERNLPRSLLLGTLIVTGLYLILNWLFLRSAPASELAGVVEIGHVAATHLFGPDWGWVMSALIAGGLFSTVGALLFTGARVCEALGRDHPTLAFLTQRNSRQAPWVAVSVLGAGAVIMLLAASFETLLTYVGFTLTLFAAATVSGLFRLHAKGLLLPAHRRLALYPVGPLLFLALAGWMVVHSIVQKPQVALVGLASVVFSFLLYAAVSRRDSSQ